MLLVSLRKALMHTSATWGVVIATERSGTSDQWALCSWVQWDDSKKEKKF